MLDTNFREFRKGEVRRILLGTRVNKAEPALGSYLVALRMQQSIDRAHRLPQPAQGALATAPIDGGTHPKPCLEVPRALLAEREDRSRRHLVGQVGVRPARKADLGFHLF
jgi:hypothetical protein